MDTLRPVEVSEYYINRVASGMCRYFWDNIFKEIFDILKDNTVYNSKDDLINAIRNGSIWYEKGAFRTKDRFSNAVATTLEDMGATFRNGAYFIAENAIPLEYSQILGLTAIQTAGKLNKIDAFLAGLLTRLSTLELKTYIRSSVELMYKKLEVDIVKSAQEKKIPVIELGITTPKATFPKTKKERLGKKGNKSKDDDNKDNPPLPPKDKDETPPNKKQPDDNKDGSVIPEQQEEKEKRYSAEEIEQYWKEKDKEAAKLHAEWEKSYKKLQKAKTEKGISARDYNKAVEDEEKASKELAEFQKDKYQNAPQLEVDIDSIELDKKSKKIAEDYTYNMEYWVKNWETKNIIKMREDVLKMVQQGARTPRIQEYFEKRWGIAKNKAKFLAENESHLAGSVIKATEYQALGCTKFKWGRSTSKEKRELHKTYYGKIFNFDEPPVIDERLGIKGLPRQVWNCKCQMLIVPPTLSELLNKTEEIQNAKRNIFKRIWNSTQRDNSAWRYRRFGQGQTL